MLHFATHSIKSRAIHDGGGENILSQQFATRLENFALAIQYQRVITGPLGAGGGTRTHKAAKPPDFESGAYTIPPHRQI